MRAHDQLTFLKKKVDKNASNMYDDDMIEEKQIGTNLSQPNDEATDASNVYDEEMMVEEEIATELTQPNDEAIDFNLMLVDLIEEEHIDEENVEDEYIVEEYLEDKFYEVIDIDEEFI